MDEIKAEPHIFIKQEYPQHPIYVKSEVQDYDEVSEFIQTWSRNPLFQGQHYARAHSTNAT
jgi:hypothetical protein